jgi:hypothetical protein
VSMNNTILFVKPSAVGYALFFLFLFVPVIWGQTCQTPDTFSRPEFPPGDQQFPLDYPHWIYYEFDNIPADSQRTQILAAISNWNAAVRYRCPWQSIIPGPNPGNGVTLTFKNGTIPDNGAARFDENVVINDLVWAATITFNPNLVISGVNFYDPNVGGYSTVFIKQAMHEIGHGFGMNHYSANHGNSCTQQLAG